MLSFHVNSSIVKLLIGVNIQTNKQILFWLMETHKKLIRITHTYNFFLLDSEQCGTYWFKIMYFLFMSAYIFLSKDYSLRCVFFDRNTIQFCIIIIVTLIVIYQSIIYTHEII